MKKTVVCLTAICLLTLLFSACRPAAPQDGDLPNETGNPASSATPQTTDADTTATVPDEHYAYLPVKIEGEGMKCEFCYNENGHLIGRTGTYPDGQTETLTYAVDEAGNLLRDTMFDPLNQVMLTFDYTYDQNGLMIRRVSSGEDDRINITDYAYMFDENGNIIRQIGTDSNGNKNYIDYTYDQNGKLSSETMYLSEKNKTIQTYAYDEKGNMIRSVMSEVTNGGEPVEIVSTNYEYEYDETGRIVRENDAVITYAYAENGNLIKTITEDGNAYTAEYQRFYMPNGVPDWMEERLP